jgi:phenylalanyl-tRNA synthetase beta chain
MAERIIPVFRPFSRFPAVERDLSLLVDLSQSYGALADSMRSALPLEALQDLRCVDVFRHKSLPEGRQAWLIRMRFQADRTLVGEEIDAWVAAALAAAESLGASLRA